MAIGHRNQQLGADFFQLIALGGIEMDVLQQLEHQHNRIGAPRSAAGVRVVQCGNDIGESGQGFGELFIAFFTRQFLNYAQLLVEAVIQAAAGDAQAADSLAQQRLDFFPLELTRLKILEGVLIFRPPVGIFLQLG